MVKNLDLAPWSAGCWVRSWTQAEEGRHDVLCDGGKERRLPDHRGEEMLVHSCTGAHPPWALHSQMELGPLSPHSCPLKPSKTTWNCYYFALDFPCSFRAVLSKWAKGDRYVEILTEQWTLGCNHFFRWFHRRISLLVFCPQRHILEELGTIFQ